MAGRPRQQLSAFLDMIRQDDYIVLDTETTGLNDAEVCQIALLDSSSQTLLDTYIKPRRPIPASAIAIHGITNEMVVDAPPWETISPIIATLVTGRHVIAYNAIFDRKMMHKSAEIAGLPKTDWKTFSQWWCAMLAFSEIAGQKGRSGFRYQSLASAAKHYQVQVTRSHTALDDCITTLAVLKGMAASE